MIIWQARLVGCIICLGHSGEFPRNCAFIGGRNKTMNCKKWEFSVIGVKYVAGVPTLCTVSGSWKSRPPFRRNPHGTLAFGRCSQIGPDMMSVARWPKNCPNTTPSRVKTLVQSRRLRRTGSGEVATNTTRTTGLFLSMNERCLRCCSCCTAAAVAPGYENSGALA